ncbi:21006_t:CDS:2, partial [Gigaspora margarita]
MEKFGYEVEVRTPVDFCSSLLNIELLKYTAIAYADDTTWLAKDKKEIEKILKILGQELFIRQVIALQNGLNRKGAECDIIRMRLKQTILDTGLLIDQNGINLILWQQLKTIRNMTNRERATKWFKTVKKAVLVNQESRQIKSNFQVKVPNPRALCLATMKVERKTKKKLLTTNWWVTENIVSNNIEVECDNYGKSLEYQWIQAKDVITCLPYSCIKENKKVIKELDVKLIEKQGFNEGIRQMLEIQLVRNKKRGIEVFCFYTDSSLRMEGKDLELCATKKWIKQKNFNALLSIRDIVVTKKLELLLEKKIFQMQTGAAFACSGTLKGIEYNNDVTKFNWQQTRGSYFGSMPNGQSSSIYETQSKESKCIVCNEDKEESFNHLMECTAYQVSWKNIEDIAIEATWYKLLKEAQKKIDIK